MSIICKCELYYLYSRAALLWTHANLILDIRNVCLTPPNRAGEGGTKEYHRPGAHLRRVHGPGRSARLWALTNLILDIRNDSDQLHSAY